MREIRSARLRLVPVVRANARVLWRVFRQPGLREYQDLPDLDADQFERTVAARPSLFEPSAAGRFEWLIYVVADAVPAQPAGWVSLRIADRSPNVGEIGYSLVTARRERGIATESVGALAGEGFVRGRLRSLRAYCVPENRPSRAVLERNAFEEDGLVPRGATVRGLPVDIVAYVLHRQRWEALRATRNLQAT